MPARSSATLSAARLSVTRGELILLSEISLIVAPETRLGIVGPNGVGKSTLLRILAGLEPADSGSIGLSPPDASVGYLPQERELMPGETSRAFLERRTGVAAAEADLKRTADSLTEGKPNAADDYAQAFESWQRLGGDDFDQRALVVLEQVGLSEAVLDLAMSSLSGGQGARVGLAAILLSRFDIVLLDEPTNDLDHQGLDALEQFVHRVSGGVVLVSHDRAFLEATVTSVLEIDEHDHTGNLFDGGWTSYLRERAIDRRHAEERYTQFQDQKRELTDRARREREWATSGTRKAKRDPKDSDKAQRDFRINRTEQLASRARRTERALSRLETVEKPWEGWDLRFGIERASRSGAVVVRLEDAVIERGSFGLGPLDLAINWAERVELRGLNGTGKTTLIEAILGNLGLTAGRRYVGPSVVFGTLAQTRQAFDANKNLLEAFLTATGFDLSTTRSTLAKFGLGAEDVSRPVRSLSPGERTRAELALFQAKGVNTVVLDEPTNHLDLPAVEQLESALGQFEGTLLIVTHDRRFREAVQFTRTIDLEDFPRSHR